MRRLKSLLVQVPAIIAVVVVAALLAGAPSDGVVQFGFLAAIGKVLAGGVKRTIGGLVNKGKRQALATIQGVALGAATPPILRAIGGGGPPSLPAGFAPQGTPRAPAGPITRLGQRLIPGGKSGKEYTPFEGTELDRMGRPIAVYPDTAERLVAPYGYVIVYPWGPEQEPIAMLKGAARAMGLWKSRPKPPVSGYDMRAITRAKSATGRVKRLAHAVGLKTARKGA